MIALTSHVTAGVAFHVAPDGNDAGPGTGDEPFASLERARDAVRARRGPTGASPDDSATIWLADGTHLRGASLELGRQDSHLTIAAGEGASARVSGGVALDLGGLEAIREPALRQRLPTATRDAVRVIDLSPRVPNWHIDAAWPDTFRGYAGWPEVFIDGKPLRLARWPTRRRTRGAGSRHRPAGRGRRAGELGVL